MQITCPHCGFSKEVEAARIPRGTVRVACPDCGERFPFAAEAAPVAADAPAGADPAVPAAVEAAGIEARPEAAAGFWVRAVALMVDGVLVTIVQVLLGIAFGLSAAGLLGGSGGEDGVLLLALTWLFGSTVAMAYYVFFTGYCGQTPGKMALRLKVLRCDGGEVGFGRAFLREIPGKFLSGVLLGLGYLMVVFDVRKQGLHDRIAGTCVIKLP